MKRTKRKQGRPKAGQIFRQIAQGLLTSKNIALGSFGRRIRSKKGPAVAIKATTRKLAELYWRTMVNGTKYAEQGVKKYEMQLLAQKQKSIERLAKELNLQLINIQTYA
jgi:transposase